MATSRRVLVVDDDAALRETLTSLLEGDGLRVRAAGSAREALERAGAEHFDVVLSDIEMPGPGGLELLGALRAMRCDLPVILMTDFGSIDSAVEVMRAGAFDYLTKPAAPPVLQTALARALEHCRLQEENRFGELIGASPQLREIIALLRRIAHSASNVLITGESGTGKEVVARSLHFAGARARRPFVVTHCTALPEGLLESELFGHARGAFTGAHDSKVGLFEEAEGGTLFLDEIGDMAPGLQGKLLRVLQDREIRPVGGNRAVRVDVRIVAATSRNLREEIERGRFRRDLFHRLNVIPLHIPPLRERVEDIPLLAEHFVRRYSCGTARRISAAAHERLRRLPWPGNARQLENAIERALALAVREEIGPEDVCEQGFAGSPLQTAADERLTLRQLAGRYVAEILTLTGGNKTRAARILGVNRRTLYDRAHTRARGRGLP